jgi:hypothetical protein
MTTSITLDFKDNQITGVEFDDFDFDLPENLTALANKIVNDTFPKLQSLRKFATSPNFSIILTPEKNTPGKIRMQLTAPKSIAFVMTAAQIQQIFGNTIGQHFQAAEPPKSIYPFQNLNQSIPLPKPLAPRPAPQLVKPEDCIQRIKADGNCLFSCFAAKLGGDHVTLRQEAVLQLRENKDLYEVMADVSITDYKDHTVELLKMDLEGIRAIPKEEIKEQNRQTAIQRIKANILKVRSEQISYNDYIDRLSKDRFHGSFAEIAALSDRYQVPVLIVRRSPDGCLQRDVEPVNPQFRGPPIILVNGGNHFDLMNIDKASFNAYFNVPALR